MSSINSATQCHCQSGRPYHACCELLHQGLAAPSAEALMRSRYAAFVLQLEDYLLNTWHPKTRPTTLNLAQNPPTKWLGLQIQHTKNTSKTTATVAFIVRYKIAGKATRLHEVSQFEHINGRWYYVTSEFIGE